MAQMYVRFSVGPVLIMYTKRNNDSANVNVRRRFVSRVCVCVYGSIRYKLKNDALLWRTFSGFDVRRRRCRFSILIRWRFYFSSLTCCQNIFSCSGIDYVRERTSKIQQSENELFFIDFVFVRSFVQRWQRCKTYITRDADAFSGLEKDFFTLL